MELQEHQTTSRYDISQHASEGREMRTFIKEQNKSMLLGMKWHESKSISEIATELRVCTSTVDNYIKELKQSGHIPQQRLYPINQYTKNRKQSLKSFSQQSSSRKFDWY